jgi:hypothetical protein
MIIHQGKMRCRAPLSETNAIFTSCRLSKSLMGWDESLLVPGGITQKRRHQNIYGPLPIYFLYVVILGWVLAAYG